MSHSADSSEIYLLKMIETRKLEVNALNNEVKRKCAKLSTQRLPPYMRRRAASHNPKRVPKSVRCLIKQTSDQTNTKNKKSKKYKNKKKLEMSVKRRRDKSDRTVLHQWFAKRFSLENRWNYLLPIMNRTKNQRILYRNSKNDAIFFDLSHIRCIQIDYSNTSKQNLFKFLSHFTHWEIGYGFGTIDCLNGNCEGITVLFKYDSYPFEAICVCSFIWHQTIELMSLWVHISAYHYVLQQLISDAQKYIPDSKLNFIKSKFERFQLIGPKSYELLSKCFNSNVNVFQKSDQSTRFISYFRFNVDNSLLSISNAKSFEEGINLSTSDKLKEMEFKIINNNNIFNKRYAIDIIMVECSAKYIWNKLTRNKSHKVGGLRDIQMIALNTSSLLFPCIGFIDIEVNRQTLKLLEVANNNVKRFHVMRNALIVSRLAKCLNSSVFSELSDESKNDSLINVELICLNRGVPNQFDYILMPNDDDIEHVNHQTVRFSHENRKIIGLIEFGTYSLEVSRGKAIGVIVTRDLELLIKFNEQKNFKKIYAIIKSEKSSNYFMVTVNAINTAF